MLPPGTAWAAAHEWGTSSSWRSPGCDFRAPGNRNLDFSMMKTFPICERLTLQFRAEAFNVLNQVVFSAPNTTVGSASFGVIGGQGNTPRNIQLALKLLW